MNDVSCQVKLLSMTENAQSLIYVAFRQCYFKGFVGDNWEKFLIENNDAQIKLIEETVKSGHTSPIEHVTFSFAISGISRSLSHQLVRHRIASFSQQSQRYCDASNIDCIIPPAIKKNPEALLKFNNLMNEIQNTYKYFTENDIKAEDARYVLPNAAETKIVVTMNCRSLLNFFEHRCCTRAQWEIRHMANQMLHICKDKLPVVFNNAGAKCERFKYCPEGEKFTCGKYPLMNN